MTLGRRIAKGRGAPCTKKVMPHAEFIDRIRKSLYFGCDTRAHDMQKMSRPLADLASEIFSEPHKGHSLNRLNTVAAGKVHATPCSLIMALIYLDRINATDPGYVRRITPQELFIVSMMISTKFYAGYDEDFYLSDWAADGNMSDDRLKQLELKFLCAIDWNIYISNEQFFEKLSNVETILARREGLRRGWLTYTELMQMLPTFTVVKFLLSNITVMAISYAASVMTIAGAFFLASQVPGTILHRKTIPATVNKSTEMSLTNNTILSPPTDSHNLHSNVSAVIDIDAGESNVVTIISKPNATCNALNVELELLKLERQYREDAEREELRHRNNELISDNRLTLPNAVEQKLQLNGQTARDYKTSEKLNWNALKGQFRETTTILEEIRSHIPTSKHVQMTGLQLGKYFTNWNNGTNSLFWQLLTGTAEQSFVRLSWPWYKLI